MSLKHLARVIYPYGRRRVLQGSVRDTYFVIGKGMGATYALSFEEATPAHLAS